MSAPERDGIRFSTSCSRRNATRAALDGSASYEKKTRQGSAGDANQREATREIRGKKVVSLVIVPIDTATNNIKESPIDFPSHTLRPRRLDRITGL